MVFCTKKGTKETEVKRQGHKNKKRGEAERLKNQGVVEKRMRGDDCVTVSCIRTKQYIEREYKNSRKHGWGQQTKTNVQLSSKASK
jgi:hypothetical protein